MCRYRYIRKYCLSPGKATCNLAITCLFCPPHYADSGEKGINLITCIRAHALSNALASDNLRARRPQLQCEGGGSA